MESLNSKIIMMLDEYLDNIKSLQSNLDLLKSLAPDRCPDQIDETLNYHLQNYENMKILAIAKGIISE